MCKCQSEFSISGLVDFYHRSTAADIWRYRDRDTLMKLTMQLLSNIMPNRYIKLWQVASKQFLWILATVVRAAESDVDQTWILGYLQWMLMLQICNVMTVGSRIQNVDVLHSRVWDLRGATRGSCCWSKIGDCKPLLMFPNEQISLAAAAAVVYTSQVRGGSVGSSSETLQAGIFLPNQNNQNVYRLNQFRTKMRTCQAVPCAWAW